MGRVDMDRRQWLEFNKKNPSEARNITAKQVQEQKKHDKMLKKEIATRQKMKQKGYVDKDRGYSNPGYNIGLGTYVRDKDDYKRKERELRRKGVENTG